jgi:hypothetical protein
MGDKDWKDPKDGCFGVVAGVLLCMIAVIV